MATPFEVFVNDELPKRISTQDDPTTVPAGYIPVSTGVGLGVEFVDPESAGAIGKDGENGKDNYELAQDAGFTGTLVEYLISIKGEKGEDGDVGILNFQGELGSVELLPAPAGLSNGTAYFIEKHVWVVVEGGWVDGGDISGPKGIDGLGLRILGSFPGTEYLPMFDNLSGDTYIIQNKMWVWDSITWAPVGQVGPDGKSAYQLAVQFGFVGTTTQWLASLKGKSNYQLAVDQGYAGTLTQYLASQKGDKGDIGIGEKGDKGDTGDKGAKGDKGDTGGQGIQGVQGIQGNAAALVTLRGSKANQAALPATGALSDAWMIGTHVWVWDGAAWIDAGPISGPQGIQGEQGVKGDKGDTGIGEKGDKGDKGDTGDKGEIGNTGLDGKDAYQVALLDGFVGTRTAWLASLQGDTGLSAFELAQQLGFTGTLEEWVAQLQGQQGERGFKGDKGDAGAGLKVLGVVANVGALPGTAADYDSYVVGTHLHSYFNGQWNDLGEFVGEAGKSAYDLAKSEGFVGTITEWLATLKGLQGDKGDKGDKGNKGDQGIQGDSAYKLATDAGFSGNMAQWLLSLRGADGRGLIIKGTLASMAELNAITGQQPGWGYVVSTAGQNVLYAWDGIAWIDLGDLTGPTGATGKSALELAQQADPTIVDLPSFIASLKGDQGEQGDVGPAGSAFKPKGYLTAVGDLTPLIPTAQPGWTYIVGSGDVYTFDTGSFIYMGNIRGPVGSQGVMGPGITILGKKNNQSELPGSGTLGQGWLIGLDFWGWTGAAFENLGPVQGPKGDKGDKGDRGDVGPTGTGAKGDKGDTGTLWVVLGREPQPADGRRNDYYLNSQTLAYYKKTTDVLWAPLGFLGGGNVYDAPLDDHPYARLNGVWSILDVQEAPKNGKKHIRIDGAWAELVIDATPEAPDDGKLYGRKNKGWLEITIPAAGISDAPSDGKYYFRKDGNWVERPAFERYTLKAAAATATLDLAVQQVFTVSAASARTLAFANAPGANLAMTVVVKVAGNAAAITWPAGISWSGGTAPTLGASYTVVVLFWDGTSWVGSTGASA
jgi:hypothetical protein